MVRTIISLDEADKEWLDAHARAKGVSMTALVRQAVAALRSREEAERPSLETLLDVTAGMWSHGDGLAYQEGLRDEW